MQESLSSQAFIFLSSLILGGALGLAYDIFRILRMLINSKNITIFIQDVLYFVISGVITFLFVLGVNSGDSRFYILAGEGLGWIIYHITLGELIYRCTNKVVKCIKGKLISIREKFHEKLSKNHKHIE